MDYKKAGVDIEAGYKSVELMKEHIKKTMRSEVLTNIGGFSGAFSMEKFKDMEKPTLVSGTDGVGTKLKLAFILDNLLHLQEHLHIYIQTMLFFLHLHLQEANIYFPPETYNPHL